MSPRQLRYFIEIARCESISAAALQLRIAQPALSHHISALEQEFGTPLLHRLPRGVSLTVEGERLLSRAVSILRQFDDLKDDVVFSDTRLRGSVRLCLPRALASLLASPLMRHVEANFPDIRLTLSTGTSAELLEKIRSREVQIALMPNAFEIDGVATLPVFEEQLHLFGATHLMASAGTRVRFADLASKRLVMPDRDHDLRKLIERTATELNLPLNVWYEANDGELIRPLVRDGLAFSVMPGSFFAQQEWRRHVCGLEVESPILSRVQSLVWATDRPVTPSTAAVRQALITLVQDWVVSGELQGKVRI